MEAPNPYAAPQAPLESPHAPVPPTDAVPAGFSIRAAGRLIDLVVSSLVGVAGGALAGIGLVAAKAAGIDLGSGEADKSFGALAISLLIGSAGSVGYHVLSEGVGGASVGKLVLGLRVRDVDLSPARIKGALIRTLAYYVDAFFFGWVAYSAMSRSSMRQRHGDQWGDTVVVRAASLPDDKDAGTRLALGLASGMALQMFSATLSVIARRVI